MKTMFSLKLKVQSSMFEVSSNPQLIYNKAVLFCNPPLHIVKAYLLVVKSPFLFVNSTLLLFTIDATKCLQLFLRINGQPQTEKSAFLLVNSSLVTGKADYFLLKSTLQIENTSLQLKNAYSHLMNVQSKILTTSSQSLINNKLLTN